MNDRPAALQATAQAIIAEVGTVVLGKEPVIREALCTVLAGGHLLLEDLPGLGKTTLAHALARVLGLRFRRMQFTADLLPADILGVSVFETNTREFTFHPGPIFTEVLLADEINRAPPKVQSALLEAMEERQVTIEGKRYALPAAFFVIATQNPSFQQGTYPLPESQLDRFALVSHLGYPAAAVERAMLKGEGGRAHLTDLNPLLDAQRLLNMRQQVGKVHVSERVIDYVQQLLQASRSHPESAPGLSPRAGLMLLNLARAWAYIDQRDHVLPDDVQAVFPGLANHRLNARNATASIARDLLQAVTPA
ncbi:AAA family ATPase [Halothiobacillus sp. DCM-1]|uniref:AAA family ATPase n=1 Tax=Halothiobacillus sp. DCM-1 TaxID=3112558 RepID=UPI003254B377